MRLVLRTLLAALLAATVTSLKGPFPVQPQQLVKSRRLEERLPIWVHAFTRSGSSTMMSMFSEALGRQGVDNHVFALFEPCKQGDDIAEPLASQGCGGVVRSLGRCEFTNINWLKNWFDLHSRRGGLQDYDAIKAADACMNASINVFKTAFNPTKEQFPIGDRLDVLDQVDSMIMIDVVRDPRNIYSSIMSTWPFNVTAKRDPSILTGMCDSYAEGLNVTHDRMHRINFENFLRNPSDVMRKAYAFVGADFGKKQEDWIAAHVNANVCPDQVARPYIKAYSDCRTDSQSGITAFEKLMTDEEKAIFAAHGSCQLLKTAWSLP